MVERSSGGSRGDMDSELLERVLFKFDVVELGSVFSELEDQLASGFQMLDVAPTSVEVVGAFVLTFYLDKENGVGP